jgi:hypothetical protein
MSASLTHVLSKIFTAGFFRMHSGLLVFLFGTIISYCFFINTLGSVPVWAFAKWNLFITLAVVSNPLVLLLFCVVASFYAFKSWQYVLLQLTINSNEFLFYSSTSFSRSRQLVSWFIVQLNIFLPLWIYSLFATAIGIAYGYYILPVLMLLFLLALNACSAFMYVKVVNRRIDVKKHMWLMKLTRSWSKPLFSLYTFYVFDQMKLTYVLTKCFSLILIVGVSALFADSNDKLNTAGFLMLMLITAHVILIYNEYRFNETFLGFVNNFPISKSRLFLGFLLNYFILMLPELLWFFSAYAVLQSCFLLLLGITLLLLFRSLMYWSGLDMKRFLLVVFFLFNLIFILILYRLIWYLPFAMLLIAYSIFAKNRLNHGLKG